MAENQKMLDRAYMEHLLRKLDEVLVERGQRAVVYVVGGANIAMALDASRTTRDIDVVVKHGDGIVFDAARKVAESEEGLADDWLNNQFTGGTKEGGMTWPWIDNKDLDAPLTVFAGDGLVVELASREMMLALKTLAQRPQDLPDIYLLMRELGIATPEGIGKNLARFTGERIFRAQGTAGMFIHIDPKFRRIFDNAPKDLRPPKSPSLLEKVSGTRQRCGSTQEKETLENRCVIRIELRKCRRIHGHQGKHRYGPWRAN
ncbi:MAG: hypothetical protein FWG08_01800 [Propionibacteriaceae bacterium]|nr:hypothetical protein [Propionibacteriaceae bacterium]